MDKESLKKDIAFYAADALIKNGMKLGLGTGSTARWLVMRLAELLKSKAITSIYAVATSYQTRAECERLGIPLTNLSDPAIAGLLDLTIDGADEIDPDKKLIKGGGGALLLEKILADASKEYAVVADETKLVRWLGEKFPVPVEIIPEAIAPIGKKLTALGALKVELRQATGFAGPVFTERGNIILDARFEKIANPDQLEKDLKTIPGVIESGIFTRPVNHLVIGYPDGSKSRIDYQHQ
jgi:ribose 5-phosphate isomerase A